MVMLPICEPVVLPLGTTAIVERVNIAAGAAPVNRLLHFHDVAEIVVFGDIGGTFFCDGRSHVLSPGTVIFVPSMRYHDFELGDGAKNWTLIQVDPYVVDRLNQTGAAAVPARAFRVQLGDADRARFEGLCAWLAAIVAADPTDPIIEQFVALILAALCRLPRADEEGPQNEPTHAARFFPVIDRLRRDPGTVLPLHDAAVMCHLSPAYFSRRFTQIFGCGFADYVVSYRLHLAARRVATTAEPFAQIGYSLGFSSPSHFTARFRDRFGMTPRSYRRSIQGRHADPDIMALPVPK